MRQSQTIIKYLVSLMLALLALTSWVAQSIADCGLRITDCGSVYPLADRADLSASSLHQPSATTNPQSQIHNPQSAMGEDRVRAALENLPLHFIENRGQVDGRVAYYVSGRDTSVYFTNEGVTFALTGPAARPASLAAGPAASLSPMPLLSALEPAAPRPRWAVKLDFLNANPRVRLKGQDPTPAVISYFKGRRDQWKTGLATYNTLVYEELWPGIDLVYSGHVNRLKYRFVVKPGADPQRIKLAYRGATAVQLNPAGQLEVSTPLGSFHDDKPYAYQEVEGRRVEVATAYALEAGESAGRQIYGFRLSAYDHSQPLVLDPAVLVYAGYIGGNGDERALGIAVDRHGNAYVTGSTTSNQTTFPQTVGPDPIYHGLQDAFVAKVNAAGTALLYAGYIGGSGVDVGFGIAVDHDGNAYITGATSSTEASFPITRGPGLTYKGGRFDAFVAKVNAAGTGLLYCGYIGGSGTEGGVRIAVDSEGSAYVTGATTSTEATFPVRMGPGLTYKGGVFFGDAFVAKVNPDGTGLDYCGYIGGSGEDAGIGIAVDRAGNAYVTGGTTSTEATFPVRVGPGLTYKGGLRDAFVAKVNPLGTALVYCGYIGGASADTGFGIAVDREGNAYVAGETSSSEASFPVKVGPGLTYKGNGDAFVAKVNPSGTALIYCGYIGGSGRDGATGIAVDRAGNAYVTGATASTEATFPVTGGPGLRFNGGPFFGDAFVAKVNAAGTALLSCGYIGGGDDDVGYSIAVDHAGDAYVAGETSSREATFPVKAGPGLRYNGGVRDAFVAKIHSNAPPDCSRARPSLATLWPPNHRMVAVSILGVTDPDNDPITIRIDRVTQNEPTSGLRDTHHDEEREADQDDDDEDGCPDAQGLGTATAHLRAERSGHGSGRVYTVFFTASDGRGGTCQSLVQVCVPHNRQASCVDSGPVFDSTACPAPPR